MAQPLVQEVCLEIFCAKYKARKGFVYTLSVLDVLVQGEWSLIHNNIQIDVNSDSFFTNFTDINLDLTGCAMYLYNSEQDWMVIFSDLLVLDVFWWGV